jgi:hypothetical protein
MPQSTMVTKNESTLELIMREVKALNNEIQELAVRFAIR